MQKEERLKRVRVRKNFFLTLLIIVLLWSLVAGIVYLTDPTDFSNILLFLFTFFLATLLTFATILENTRRGFLLSLATMAYLFLRYLKIGSVINLLLIIGVAISFEIYFSKR